MGINLFEFQNCILSTDKSILIQTDCQGIISSIGKVGDIERFGFYGSIVIDSFVKFTEPVLDHFSRA